MLSLWNNILLDGRKAYDRRLQLALLTSSFTTMMRNLLSTLSASQRGTPTCFQEDVLRLLRLMQSVYDFFSGPRPKDYSKERNIFMKEALDELEVFAVDHLLSLLLEMEEGRVTVPHCLRTTAECSSLLQVAITGLSMQTGTRTKGQLFEETHSHASWGDTAMHVEHTQATGTLVKYFFTKLHWRLAMRLGVWSAGQYGCSRREAGACTSRVTNLLHMVDGEGVCCGVQWLVCMHCAVSVAPRQLAF